MEWRRTGVGWPGWLRAHIELMTEAVVACRMIEVANGRNPGIGTPTEDAD
jgi:hypothetical protein